MRTIHISGLVALLVLPLVAGCGIPKDQYDRDIGLLKDKLQRVENTRARFLSDYNSTQDELEKCEQERDSCDNKLAMLKSQDQQLSRKFDQALNRIKELESIAARQREIFRKLRESLQKLETAGMLRIAIVRGQFTVQLAEKILFDSGRYKLKKEAEPTLTEVGQALAQAKKRRWQVAGHTDTVGRDDYNWDLSQRRAWSVARFFIRAGIPGETVSYAGYGEHQPTVENTTRENKALNRRIEIVLIPDMEEILKPLLGEEGFKSLTN